MIPIKRQLDNSFNHLHDDKRQKRQITTDQRYRSSKETTTPFEDLSNELFYEIFEYLDYFYLYQTLSSVNQRFYNLIINSNISIPIKTSLSYMSKTTFERYNQDIIQSNLHRITSIYCSNVFMYDYVLSSIPKLSEFQRLEILNLYNIQSKYLTDLLDQLQSLSFLSSLVLTSLDCVRDINHIYRQIFRFRALKYCKLYLVESDSEPLLEVCTNEYSSIEHLVIMHCIRCSQLHSLLSSVPKLRRLSIKSLAGSWTAQNQASTNLVTDLTHLSLKITSLTCDSLIQLIKDFFHSVQFLHITIEMLYLNEVYTDANRWQQLITHHLLNLRVFDIYIDCFTWNTDEELRIASQIKQFSSSFWIEKQWFFAHGLTTPRRFLFYSTNPYRRKSYTLAYEQKDNTTSFDQDVFNPHSVQRVYIKDARILTACNNYFPNATELIFENILFSIGTPVNSLLSRIVPLKQLTKLAIECDHFFFLEVIKILRYAPNIHIFIIRTMALYQHKNDYTSIEQTEDFQLVSQTNNIRHVILDETCTIQKLQLLVTLCPRMHYLSISIQQEDLQIILRFLLDKNNANTRHLYSLRLSNSSCNCFEKVNMLITSEELLHNCTLIKSGRDFYLWW